MTDTVLAADIMVESVETKEGTSAAGKPWKLYRVKTPTGAFSTFDGTMGSNAIHAQGRLAHITYKTTEKGNDLVTFQVDESSEAAVEPVRDNTENGERDWDLIGLRKTRCALWVAAIGAGLDAGTARQIVLEAEVDIFWRQPATETEALPF